LFLRPRSNRRLPNNRKIKLMLVHPMPDPIAIQIGLAVHWYGLMYLLAFAQFIALGRLRIKQPHIAAVGWKKEDLDDMLFYGVLGWCSAGAGRVLFYNPAYYFADPADMIAVWKGGMSFHGGFLGVMLAMYLWGRKRGRNLMDIMDFIAPMVPLGYAAGRLGNFINAELPGRPADPSLPWAMIWPNVDNIRAIPRRSTRCWSMASCCSSSCGSLRATRAAHGGGRHVLAAVRLRALLHRVLPRAGLRSPLRRHHHLGRADAVGADDRAGHHPAGAGLQAEAAGTGAF
jgi:hypothetical protein